MSRCAAASPLCAATERAIDGSTRASSSMQMQYSSAVIPAPSYSAGTWMPRRPKVASLGSSSKGKRWASSHSITWGASSCSANSRTARRTIDCDSVGRRSTDGTVSHGMNVTATSLGPLDTPPPRVPASAMARRAMTMSVGIMLLAAGPASADLHLFGGTVSAPSSRPLGGIALGVTLTPVALEFEYAQSAGDGAKNAPSLGTGTFTVLLRTPTFGIIRFYGAGGGGVFRERLGEHRSTGAAVNAGGGLELAVAGPVWIRLDYRVFRLTSGAVDRSPQRATAGLSLGF